MCVLGGALVAVLSVGSLSTTATAAADDIAYLVNVTVRPGYGFTNADAALAYGHGLCDRMAQGQRYPDLIGVVKNDFATSDDYQTSYLITQSAQELCPVQIWHIRNTAANPRP
jgi:Protein of unknown function (DUF732)